MSEQLTRDQALDAIHKYRKLVTAFRRISSLAKDIELMLVYGGS